LTSNVALSLGTSNALTCGSIELGAASDTTIARVSAGVVSIEGANILVSGGALGTPSGGTVTNLTGTASININGTVGATTPTTGVFTTITANTMCQPDAVDGAALGDATHQWSDLFLAEGGVINWDNGDATLTQVGNVVTLAGADLTVDNLTANTALLPDANDGAAIGSTTLQFSDLFLAEGGVINWDNGDATITQVGNTVTLAGADFNATTNSVFAANLTNFAEAQVIESIKRCFTTTNIKALWMWDITTGTTVTDRSEAGHNLTLSADASNFAAGVSGLAKNLTTTATYTATAGDHADFTIGGSAATWIWCGNLVDATNSAILAKYDARTGVTLYEWTISFNASDKLQAVVYESSSKFIGRRYDTALTGDQGAWHVYIVTFDGGTASSGIKLYRDGVELSCIDVNAGTYTASADTDATVNTMYIGDANSTQLKAKSAVTCMVKGEAMTAANIKLISQVLLGYTNSLV
jgi:hypothetical protein